MVKNDDQGVQHDLHAYIFFCKYFQHICNMSMEWLTETTGAFQLILVAMQHLFGIESCPVLRRISIVHWVVISRWALLEANCVPVVILVTYLCYRSNEDLCRRTKLATSDSHHIIKPVTELWLDLSRMVGGDLIISVSKSRLEAMICFSPFLRDFHFRFVRRREWGVRVRSLI